MSTLGFKQKKIRGSTESLVYGAPEVMLRRVRYWGVAGEGEIAGQPGGRTIIVRHVLHDSYADPAALLTALEDLDDLVGAHGKLVYSSEPFGEEEHGEVLPNCTFERYERIPLEGQLAPMPLKDFAGTLVKDDGEPDEGWFVYLELRFRQLLA